MRQVPGLPISVARRLSSKVFGEDAGATVFDSLKKRKRGVYRAVAVPPKLLDMLMMVYGLRDRGNHWQASAATKSLERMVLSGKESRICGGRHAVGHNLAV